MKKPDVPVCEQTHNLPVQCRECVTPVLIETCLFSPQINTPPGFALWLMLAGRRVRTFQSSIGLFMSCSLNTSQWWRPSLLSLQFWLKVSFRRSICPAVACLWKTSANWNVGHRFSIWDLGRGIKKWDIWASVICLSSTQGNQTSSSNLTLHHCNNKNTCKRSVTPSESQANSVALKTHKVSEAAER